MLNSLQVKIFDKDFGIHLFEHLELPDKIRSMQSTMAELQKCYLFYKSQVCPKSVCFSVCLSDSLCRSVFQSVCFSVCLPLISLPGSVVCYLLICLIYSFIQIAAIEKKERDKRKSKKRRKSKQRTSSISKNDKSAEKPAAEQPSQLETDSKEISKEITSSNNELIN